MAGTAGEGREVVPSSPQPAITLHNPFLTDYHQVQYDSCTLHVDHDFTKYISSVSFSMYKSMNWLKLTCVDAYISKVQ